MFDIPHALDVLSQWPLLLEAAPGKLLDIRFTTDGDLIEQITCARLAVVCVDHDQEEMFLRDPWVDRKILGAKDERAKIVDLLRNVDNVPGWDGTFSDLPKALAKMIESLPL